VLVPLDFAWLTISSLGIVYGDLGTSPLYTWPTILGNLETYEEDDLVGAMCLLLYSLLAIVTIKYATFVMMADNKGEGGIFALTSLVPPTRKHIKAWKRGGDPPPRYMVWTKRACMCLCISGAGFIMGDGAITPAVSVLSAIEGTTTHRTQPAAHTGRTLMTHRGEGAGLGVVNDKVVDYEVIMGITILGLLFISQPFGSSRIAFLFGPIMLIWFAFIGGTPHSSTAHAQLRTHARTTAHAPFNYETWWSSRSGGYLQHRHVRLERVPCVQPLLGLPLLCARRRHGLQGPGRRLPVLHWSRGPVRRHGSLRPLAHPRRLGLYRPPQRTDELLWPGTCGCAVVCECGCARVRLCASAMCDGCGVRACVCVRARLV